MARYAFGNTLAAFKRSSTSIVEDTTSGRFDSAYVSNAILLTGAVVSTYIDTMPFIDASSTTVLWCHFEEYHTALQASGGRILSAFDSSGVEVIRIATSSSALVFQYWDGSTFVSMTGTAAISGTTLNRIDIKLTAGVSGTADLYINGAIAISASGMNAAVTNFATVRIYSYFGTGSTYISQLLCADYDLRDSKYMQKLADANGADTDGTGSYADINETVLDDSTAIVLPAVSNKKTFTKPSTTVPAGYVISCMTVAARGRVSGGTVTDGKLVVRSGGADYDSGSKSFNGGYEPRGHYLDNDPATGVPFTGAGYNSAEFGIKAA